LKRPSGESAFGCWLAGLRLTGAGCMGDVRPLEQKMGVFTVPEQVEITYIGAFGECLRQNRKDLSTDDYFDE